MSCRAVRAALLTCDLEAMDLKAEQIEHVALCSTCREAVEALRRETNAVRDALNAFRGVQVTARASLAHSRPRNLWFVAWVGVAVAGVLLAATTTFFAQSRDVVRFLSPRATERLTYHCLATDAAVAVVQGQLPRVGSSIYAADAEPFALSVNATSRDRSMARDALKAADILACAPRSGPPLPFRTK